MSSSKLRRENLINHMNDLDNASIDCKGCSGLCCTFRKNSMMMTPLETYDLYEYLNNNNLWHDELISLLENNIREFRLDHELSTTRNQNFRRTYTCPFFKNQSLGCPLPVSVKPYGCLAFNPTSKESSEGEGCESDIESLEVREKLDKDEEIKNLEVMNTYNIKWQKRAIPLALLDFHKNYQSI